MKPMIIVFTSPDGTPIAVNVAAIKSFEPVQSGSVPQTRINFGADANPVTLSVSFDDLIAALRDAGQLVHRSEL
jgi:hypothetical protein